MKSLAWRLSTFAFTAVAIAALPDLLLAQGSTQPVQWHGFPGQLYEFEITRDTTIAHGGRASLRIHGDADPTTFGNASVILSAEAYAGHRIRFTAFFRSASLMGPGGALWARADNANRQSVAFVNTQTTPFYGTRDWTPVTLSLDIPATAVQLFVGALSNGAGSLWIDDARLEADGGVAPLDFGFEDAAEFVAPPVRPRATIVREAPRVLSPRGLANVTAFTSALGYVRFFHPSAEAVRVNWDAFAVRGMRATESAPTPDSLASTLRALFAPIAPSVKFAHTGVPLPATIEKPATATHVVFWQHEGVGSPSGGVATAITQSVYRSARVIAPLAEVGRPLTTQLRGGGAIVSAPHVPDPSRPLSVALDGGVTMSVPVALYTTDTTVPDSLRAARPTPVAETFTAGDRAARLASVALAWSLLEHFYPYFDIVHTDWPAARTAALRAAATDANANAFDATLERLIAALHDGHGRVSRRAIATTDVQLTWAERRVLVTAVGDSAAAKGVRRGDELLAVDGRGVDSALAEQSARVSGATPQWVRTRAVAALLTGDFGSVVQVRLRASDGSTRDVRLTRSPSAPPDDKRVDKIADVSPGVMYVDIGRITDADFASALPRLERAQSIIFDMRGYPRQVNTAEIFRHLTDTTIHSAHFEVPVITMPNFRDVGYIDGAWNITPSSPRLKARIVFVSGGGAISYAESTLGVVEAYRLGDIVGEASAGTNGNVNAFMLPGGYSVGWTGMLVQKRDGTPHHGVGILPTVPVSPTVAGIRAGRDEVLERAIDLVKQRPATP